MTKLALSAVVGFLGLALPLAAQGQFTDGLSPQPPAADGAMEPGSPFDQAEIMPNRLWRGFPSLTLADEGRFFYPATFAWMNATASDFLPAFQPVEPRRARVVRARPHPMTEGDSYVEVGEERARLFEIHGEVDFLYGRSTGKYGGDFKQTYIMGEIGNDNFRLSVGAAFSEWDARGRRSRR